MRLFGFEIKKASIESGEETKIRSFVSSETSENAIEVDSAYGGGASGASSSVMSLDDTASSEADLVQTYRSMMQHPEVQLAVDDIVNEAIVVDNEKTVEVILDELDIDDKIKNLVSTEFDHILTLLNFKENGYDLFWKWYVDGRIYFHLLIDEENPKGGVVDIRYIDPRKLRRVKEYEKKSLPGDSGNQSRRVLKNDYYLYTEHGFNNALSRDNITSGYGNLSALRVSKDAIASANSGLVNQNNTLYLSHLQKALKPLNQLRMMEDATVIYRIVRAPERRVFYVDVGNLPKAKAEQHLRDMMQQHKNKLVYDADTGNVKDAKRHMTMTDDFWMTRREGGKGTEIDTLPGGQNLGEMDDVFYFQKKLYKALNVPITRMEPETGFAIGRATEISRDEVKFAKFIKRLRNRFSAVLLDILRKQVILKNIISVDDWDEIENRIYFDYQKDNHFDELKQGEVLRERLALLRDIDEYTGRYFSKDWIRREILQMSDTDIEDQEKLMKKEKEEAPEEDDDGILSGL